MIMIMIKIMIMIMIMTTTTTITITIIMIIKKTQKTMTILNVLLNCTALCFSDTCVLFPLY